MQAIPEHIRLNFDKALALSLDHNSFFISVIAQELRVSKDYFIIYSAEYEELSEIMDVVSTNLEANILRGVQGGYLDIKFAQFCLESVHGWRADGSGNKTKKIGVEGIGTDDLRELLLGDEDNEIVS